MRPSLPLRLALIAPLLAPAAALALHRATPPAARITRGAPAVHPSTRSWGYTLAFSSTEDLAATGSSGRQVFVFSLFDYDCAFGIPIAELSSCPPIPPPYLRQATTGPGDADNPSVDVGGNVVAFDADGAYGGGAGPGVGRRQIFVKDLATGVLRRLTDAADGDSIRPSLTKRGGLVVFESTAALRGGPSGVSQIFAYDLRGNTLRRLTNGAGPSTAPSTTELARLVAFESTADLTGDGHDTGVSQIFWFNLVTNELRRLTNGNLPSRRPYVMSRLRVRTLRRTVGRGTAILFESDATNLPGTAGGPGTQVYVGTTRAGDLPPLVQVTPVAALGCTPPAPGDATFPVADAFGRRIVFLSTGDLLCNGTTGTQAFVYDPKKLPATLFQITARGDVHGPIAASMGHWFLTLATTDDLTGTGVCGPQLHVVDFYTGHWQAATVAGELPLEPPPGDPTASCEDGDPCTLDACVPAVGCTRTPIPACP